MGAFPEELAFKLRPKWWRRETGGVRAAASEFFKQRGQTGRGSRSQSFSSCSQDLKSTWSVMWGGVCERWMNDLQEGRAMGTDGQGMKL